MTDPGIFVAGLALLLFIDFLFLAPRAAFSLTNHARLLSLREQMEQRVNQTAQLQRQPRLLATLKAALVLVRFLIAGWVLLYTTGQTAAQPKLASLGMILLAGVGTVWFEGIVEKQVARNPETWAIRFAPFVRVLMVIFTPILAPIRLPKEPQRLEEAAGSVTEDELKTLVDAGQEEGVFEVGERRMIYSVFELGDTLAREIMVPRIDMLALDVSTPLEEAADALLDSGHSRVPVYSESVDNMLGVLYAKDLLNYWRDGQRVQSLRDLLRPPYFIPEAKKVDELMAEMQSQRIHIAIVVDEYGGVAGLVTLEDIVEELVGEIQDEYDQAEELPYQVLEDGAYIFLGRIDMDDFNEIMGSSLPKVEADTLGGFIYSRLGRVPNVGETVREDKLILTVEQVSARRIRKVRARWEDAQADGLEEKNGSHT